MRAKKIKKYEELGSKIRDLIRSITKSWDDYDEKKKNKIKIKFTSDNELPLNKTLEISSIIIVVRAVFMKIASVILSLYKNSMFW